MYDLRVVVEEVRGFCDLPMKPGDYFELRGGRLMIPAGKHMCMWALQSLMPMLPLKQRETNEENDWVPTTHRMVCPDPNGLVIYRIDRIPMNATPEPVGGDSHRVTDDHRSNRASDHTGDRTSACTSDRTTDSRYGIPPRLLVNENVCSGCRSCELACSLHHTGSFAPELARIRVDKIEEEGRDCPLACRQCGNAPCVAACPEGALERHPVTRALVLAEERCAGCGACVKACIFDALRLAPPEPDSSAGTAVPSRPLVCDLCGGDPECVKRCATGALKFGRAGGR